MTVGTNRTLTVNAANYARETHAHYRISCGNATSIDTTEISTVTRNGCVFTVTPKNVQGPSGFTVPYTSTGGGTANGRFDLQVGPASTIVFNAPSPTPTILPSTTVTLDVGAYASDGTYTITCGTITESSALISLGSQTGCSIPITAGSTSGTATISVPYISSGGHSSTQSVSVQVIPASDITFNGPTDLKVGTNRTQVIDALDYATETDASYTITCGEATSIDTTEIMSVTRSGCVFTITPTSTEGSASFVVPYTSSGGDTENGTINIEVGPPSTITYEGPTGLQLGTNRTRVIDASNYVSESHSGYAISCGDATAIDTTEIMSVARSGCMFTVTPTAVEGAASFTVPYTSEGGHSVDGVVNITVGPASTITFTDPQLTQGSNLLTLTINALDYISENMAYTVTCGAATSIDTTEISSVTQASAESCSYTITLTGTAGASGFTIPYTSSGGHSESGAVTLTVGATSSISFNAPSALKVGRNQTLEIDASSYASDGSYTITCGDATGVDATKMAVTRAADSCTFTVDPEDTLAAGSQGDTTFSVAFTSSGGATATGVFTVNIGPDSTITYNAPTGLTVGRNQTLTIDASSYASDGGYTISCGDATSIDSTRLTSVTRTANSCSFTITPISTLSSSLQGDATFTVPFSSDGRATANGIFTVNIGPDSTITFTAPTGLKVGRNRTLVIDASAHATEADSNNTISCGDATGVDASKMAVTHTGSSCTFTVDPVNSLAPASQGDTTFTVPFTSTGGATANGMFTVNIGPDSTITWNSPGTLTVGRNRTRAIDASDYVSEVSGSGHTITCSDATAIDSTKLTSVARTANTCSYTITPITTLTPAQQGNATFTITFTSDGGHEITRTLTVYVGPDSTIVFAAPASNPAVAASRTRNLDVSSYATDGSYTITCGTITESDPDISLGTQDGCIIPIIAGSSSNQTADITIPYISSGGHTTTGTLTLDVGAASSITFTAPTNLKVGTNRTQTINILDYASDSGYTITCGTATNTAADAPTTGTVALTSVVRDASGNGCGYTITPTSTQGTATFTIPLTSDGGDSTNANISIEVGAASTISYNAPPTTGAGRLRVGRNLTLEIDASSYVSDGSYTISCGDAAGVDADKMTVTRTANSCTFTIDPVDALTPGNQGSTTFTVPFTSEGGHSRNGIVTVNIGPDSALTFTAPSTFTLGRNRTLVIDALAAVSGENAAYTVTCADATGVDANRMTVTRSSSGDGCSFTVDPVDTLAVGSQGDTTFSVAYTSTGGATASGTYTINIGPDSTITANIPPATGAGRLLIGRNLTLEIDASGYVTEASNTYTISCSDARNIHSRLSSVGRTANTCTYNIDPLNSASTGAATFVVTFTSTGGHSIDRTITVNVGPNSAIAFNAPPTTGAGRLLVGRNQTLVVDAASYASETSGSGYTITCGDATSIDSTRLASVTHTGSSCSFTVTPVSTLSSTLQATAATFTVPYTSSGGATATGTISVKVGPDSSVTFTAPSTFTLGRNRTLVIDAAAAISGEDSEYSINCADATGVDATKMTVSHTGSSCSFTVDPVDSLAAGSQGDTTFSVPFTSTGGATASGTFTVNIGPDSTITYAGPGTLTVGRNRTLEIDASGYVEETSGSSYTISCSDAAGVDTSKMAVSRTANTCTYTIDPVDALTPANQGNATFAITFTSTGSHTITRTITVNIGPDSEITFMAPASHPAIAASRTRTIDVSSYATDGSYTISCGAITESDPDITLGTQDGCRIPVTAGATPGQTADISIPYSSSGGATLTSTLTLDVGAASNIVFNAPTGLTVGTNRTLAIDALDYAADGGYTITCGAATNTAADVPTTGTVALTSVVRDTSGNGCGYTITPTSTQGTATFTIPYTSDGGDTANGNISITVGAASTISYSSPGTLRIGRNLTLEIDASSYASDGSYTITCADATGVDNTKLTSVTRTANTCTYTIDPVDALAPADQGTTTFSVVFTSTGGHIITRTITVNIGPDSALTFTAPTGLKIGRNRTLAIDALAAVSGENAAYTVSCADATGVDANKMTVTRSSTGNRCSFTVDPVDTLAVGSQGDATFSVAFTSTGGATASGTFTVNIGPDSTIVYTAPVGLQVGRNRTLSVDLSSAATDGSYTVSCGDATNIHSRFSSVTRPDAANMPCVFAAAPLTTASLGTATFIVPFASDGGAASTGTVSVTIGQPSTIVFTAPAPALQVGINRTRVIDASDYVRDGNYTISCGDATGVDSTKLTTVTRSSSGNGCGYTINPISTLTQSQQGHATFTVPYRSAGGHVLNQVFDITVGPASTIVYTAPVGANTLTVGHNRTLTIDASSYVADGSYTIACADARSIHASIDHIIRHIVRHGCDFTITPVAGMTGAATFTIPYSSAGGHTLDGQVSVTIGAASAITYSAPSGIVIPLSTARTIDVSSYATDGSYAISCGDATGINASRLASVTHTGSSCSFEVTTAANQGATSFVVPYRSSGGATLNGTVSLSVGPASNIVFTAPAGLDVHVGETLLVHANDYASDGPYSLQCGTAASVSASLASVVRTAGTCDYTITPGSSTGTGTFNVPYTSSGGGTTTGTISVNISPQSTIIFSAPTGLIVAAGNQITVDASTATDTGYTVSCGTATAVNPRITSVSRTACSYVVTAGNTAGSASFTIPFTSTGGATLNAQIAITIGLRSNIIFTAPTGLSVQIGSTLTIDASDYTTDSIYTITCGDAAGVPSVFTSVARTANTCNFTITPGTSTGSGSFTVPYTSSGGGTRNGRIAVAVTPTSNIVFTAPTDLEIGAGNTRTINLASHATDGPYSITCGNATATEPAKLTDIHRNGCRYTITAAATAAQGDTTFTFTYTSSGTDTHDASFTITIGPASDIVYTAPTDITLQANSARGIDLSSYAKDGTGNDAYTIGCLDATDIDPEISSVTRNGCVYTVRAGSTPGDADFHITYTSTGGDTHLATVHITITPAPTRPEERPERPIIPPAEPTRRPTPPPPTTTTTTTIPDPSRPTTTLEPDQPGPRWNTLTAQAGGTTPAQIRQAFNLGSGQTIYTWNAARQTWTRVTRPTQTIPAGTRVSFRTEEAVTNREMRTSNLGGGTTRTRLTTGWNTLSIPQGIARTDGANFLLDPALTDCRNQQGIIAIASYSTRSRRWSISLPCHPTAQRRLTTGQNAPYRPLMSIAPADTTYIFTRTRQPLNIRWNEDTQTYQAFQSIFG